MGSSSPRNVLVIMYDQITAAALGCYGNTTVSSPAIDALAAGGVVFDAAYSNSPLCTPGRYCFMTGRLPSVTRGYDNAAYLAGTIPTFAHHLRAGGYRTILAGKMHFIGADQLHGFEERRTTDIYPADFGWTPDWRAPEERDETWSHNMDSVTGAGVAEVTNQLLFDDEVGHESVRALHDLVRSDDERPWLLVASFTHPHDPYVTRQKYWDRYEGVDIPLPEVGADDVEADPHTLRLRKITAMDDAEITDDDVRAARRAYYGNVSYVVDWTARLVATLDALGVRDDTTIVLVADHGDMLGERGLWYKMNFFEGAARIPLVVNSPAYAPGRVAAPVSLLDLLPTLTDLADRAGYPCPAPVDPLPGRSLLELCERPDTDPDAAPAVLGEYCGEGSLAPIVMIRQGRYKFVHCSADPDQLYDLAADPHERTNLAGHPEHAQIVADFRADVAARWDLSALFDDVLADQDRRRLISSALRQGVFTPWEYTPPRHAEREYMRNHLDLNEVERLARWPRPARPQVPHASHADDAPTPIGPLPGPDAWG